MKTLSPPPIRYPLPMLVLAVALGCAAWAGQGIIRKAATSLAGPVNRVVNGPDYPESSTPKLRDGAIVRKVLLLRDEIPVRARPNLNPIDSFGRRGFADLFDVWPSEEKPTHYRIGNGRLIGWVEAGDVLPWDTRLALRFPAAGDPSRQDSGAPKAVISWKEGSVEVASWKPGKAWTEIESRDWLPSAQIPDQAWVVLLTDSEIVALRRAARKIGSKEDARKLRLRALLGNLIGDDSGPTNLNAARLALPARAMSISGGSASFTGVDLLESSDQAGATWGGLTFRAIRLDRLP